MLLSILICTIDSRKNEFNKLLTKLKIQALDEVEILSICDNKEMTIGAKRNKLLEMAEGDYVCFVDDDDSVSDDYINSILKAIKKEPDCIGFQIECNMEGKIEKAIASNRYDVWCENKDGYRYCRTIYHKTPTKRSIALQIGYKDIRYAEDHDYSLRLKQSGLLKEEVFIDKVLYYYNYKFENPNTKYNLNGK